MVRVDQSASRVRCEPATQRTLADRRLDVHVGELGHDDRQRHRRDEPGPRADVRAADHRDRPAPQVDAVRALAEADERGRREERPRRRRRRMHDRGDTTSDSIDTAASCQRYSDRSVRCAAVKTKYTSSAVAPRPATFSIDAGATRRRGLGPPRTPQERGAGAEQQAARSRQRRQVQEVGAIRRQRARDWPATT